MYIPKIFKQKHLLLGILLDNEYVKNDQRTIKAENVGKCLFPWNNAATSYYEKKYLIAGRKYFNDSIYDVVKWLLPIAIITVSLFTTFTNIQLSKDKLNMQQQIDKIKQELSNQKVLERIAPQTKIYHDSPFSRMQ